ncbi:MAG: flagellar basal body L-ring protein FlgH [Deltaproteobacteria bacterium]|nr:flagellar basal body L-ring protein FlgH [Deltaproteobacteria bacterium]
MKLSLRALFAALLVSACAAFPYPYVNHVRNYKPDTYASSLPANEAGSLYNAGATGLFRDTRAARLGDIITIKVDESEVASHEASTNLSRDSSIKAAMPALFDIAARLQAAGMTGVDLNHLMEVSMGSKFDGEGKTARSGKLIATIQARVKRVLPNDDLYLEGQKVVAVNGEDHHLYISGVIRQQDVSPDNSVASSRVADAQVVYNGFGVLSDNQRQGWLARLFTILSPL